MTGPSERDTSGAADRDGTVTSPLPTAEKEDGLFDSLARAADGGLSRRQVAQLGGVVALAAIVPQWAMPGGVSPARAASRIAEASAKQTGLCPKPAAGTCPESRVLGDWSKGCSHPVSLGFPSTFNGCGPEGGVVLETVNLGDIVPDQPFGLADFFGSCKGHDCCYGTCGSDKDECDRKFRQGNIDQCHKAWGGKFDLMNYTNLAYCLTVAEAYYEFVHKGGQDAYDAAQASLCGCCQTCEERALADGAPADTGRLSPRRVPTTTVRPDA